MTEGLRSLFCPKSIAIVGASATPGKAGNAMVRSLLGFPGELSLVNPTTSEIEGRPVARSVTALGAPVDLAVLVVPAGAVPSALEDCGAGGVKAVVICAGGFAETAGGAPSRPRSRRSSVDTACACSGRTPRVHEPGGRRDGQLRALRDPARAGPASIIASSGGMNLAVSFLASGEGLGLRLGVGLGNTATWALRRFSTSSPRTTRQRSSVCTSRVSMTAARSTTRLAECRGRSQSSC